MDWYWIVLISTLAVVLWISLSALFYKAFFKRFYDIVLSGVALIVLSPVFLILTITGAIVMRGNPFFVQQRPGKNEIIFNLIKFRSMDNRRDKNGDLLPDQVRLNKYGRFLRKTSLDELPELFNIFVGNMSIIGPRPLLIEYLPYYSEVEKHRHDVRPGLTGWAQVNGRNNIKWGKRFSLDVEYVNSISLTKDLLILLLTLMKVLKRSDILEDTNTVEGNFAKMRQSESENNS